MIYITGPIGVGKTTFSRGLLSIKDFTNFEFINTDLYYYMYFLNDKGAMRYNYEKAKEYCKYKLNKVIYNDKSFIWEDVLTKKEKIEVLRNCVKRNYKISGYFIGIDDYKMLFKRVNLRGIDGWYDVPNDKVISRYNEIMNNFKLLCQLSMDFFAFDSKEQKYELVYAKCNNNVKYICDSCNWIVKYLNK